MDVSTQGEGPSQFDRVATARAERDPFLPVMQPFQELALALTAIGLDL